VAARVRLTGSFAGFDSVPLERLAGDGGDALEVPVQRSGSRLAVLYDRTTVVPASMVWPPTSTSSSAVLMNDLATLRYRRSLSVSSLSTSSVGFARLAATSSASYSWVAV
jgi:hypothetical protein